VVGLANTINEYTRDHYVKNYTKILVESLEENDCESIEGVVKRLLSWYQKVIEDIRNDKFIYNKEQHEKSIKLLEDIYQVVSCKETYY
jgi:DNA-binding ferritin-like protein